MLGGVSLAVVIKNSKSSRGLRIKPRPPVRITS
jgi:hypothetical protein